LLRIRSKIIDGQQIALLIPEYAPPDVRDEIVGTLLHRRINIESIFVGNASPSEQLNDMIEGRRVPVDTFQAGFVIDERLSGRTFWLDNLSLANWPAWKLFIEEIQALTRNLPRSDRFLFVVPLVGELAQHVPEDRGGLSILKWDDVVSRYDMLQYVDAILSRQIPRVERRIMVEIIASLAGFDIEVADILSDASFENLLSSDTKLLEIAEARAWERGHSPTWWQGSVMSLDGEFFIHSALPDSSHKLRLRRWSALMSTVFVLLESHRQALIAKYSMLLPSGDAAKSLEFAELFDLLSTVASVRTKKIPTGLLNHISRLRYIRNKLAHFEVPEPALLCEALRMLSQDL